MNVIGWSVISVFGVSLLSLVGIVTLSWGEARVRALAIHFVSFAVGALLGEVFIHLLPESFAAREGHLTSSLLVLAGLLGFFVLERFLRAPRFRVHPEHAHDHPPFVLVNLAGDALHNLVDGMLIGASYLVSGTLGLATTLAVALHEVPQEIADFGVLVRGGLSIRRVVAINLLTASTAFIGLSAALVLGAATRDFAAAVVPITAGGFIYLAAADLIPELQHEVATVRGSVAQVVLIACGIGVMVLLDVVHV